MPGVDVDDVVAGSARAPRRVDVPAAQVGDVAFGHRARLDRVIAVDDDVARRHRRDAAVEVRRVVAVVAQLDAGERAVFVHRVGHQPVLWKVAIIPDAALEVRRNVGARMNFDFLRADHAPAALGLDGAVGGLGARPAVTERIAMRHLEEAVRRRHRSDFDRLEQNVVLRISAHRITTRSRFTLLSDWPSSRAARCPA